MGEPLLVLALGIVAWLLTVVLQAWLKRPPREAVRDGAAAVPTLALRERPRQPPAVVVPRGTPLPAVGPLVVTRQRAPMRLGSRRAVRRAMVLMTILGPCRALELPHPPHV
jgi:hypothetical protein